MKTPDVSLVLPVFNESGKLLQTISDIRSVFEIHRVDLELVVVNDGSTDHTRALLDTLEQKGGISVIHFSANKGYATAILEGLKQSTGDTVGWCDGDGQISAQDIFNVYDHMRVQQAVAAKAIRIIRRESLFRKVQSFVFNFLFVLLFGNTTWDTNAKPKFMKRHVYESMKLTNKRYFIDAEWVIRLNRANIPFVETPIEFLKRTHDKSKIYFWTSLEFMRDMILYALRLR